MKRIAAFLLLVVLSLRPPMPAQAQRMSPEENARQSQKAIKKQQKMLKKANKKQAKAAKKAEKKQQEGDQEANAAIRSSLQFTGGGVVPSICHSAL